MKCPLKRSLFKGGKKIIHLREGITAFAAAAGGVTFWMRSSLGPFLVALEKTSSRRTTRSLAPVGKVPSPSMESSQLLSRIRIYWLKPWSKRPLGRKTTPVIGLTNPSLWKRLKNWDEISKYAWGWLFSSRQKNRCKSSNKGRGGFPFPNESLFSERLRNSRISDGWTFVGRINLWMVLGDRSIFHISPSMIGPKAVVVDWDHRYNWGSHPCGKGTVQSAVVIDKVVSFCAWLPNWYQWKIEQMHVELRYSIRKYHVPVKLSWAIEMNQLGRRQGLFKFWSNFGKTTDLHPSTWLRLISCFFSLIHRFTWKSNFKGLWPRNTF